MADRGKKVYPTFAGLRESETAALDDLRTLGGLDYTLFSTRYQTRYVYRHACASLTHVPNVSDWTEKIPGILQAVVNIIGRATGAAVYAFGAWDDMGKKTVITEYVFTCTRKALLIKLQCYHRGPA